MIKLFFNRPHMHVYMFQRYIAVFTMLLQNAYAYQLSKIKILPLRMIEKVKDWEKKGILEMKIT